MIITVYQQKADGTPAMLIPKPIQERLGIVAGTRLMVYVMKKQMICEPIDSTKKLKPRNEGDQQSTKAQR